VRDDAEADGQVAGHATIARVHRRQFVLGPRPLLARPDWRQQALGRHVLSVDPELRLGTVDAADGTRWRLLGIAVETRADRAPPLDALSRTPRESVPALYHHWAGRWLLVDEHEIHPDACATLGCLYGHDAAGDLWVSSSPALLARALSIPTVPDGWTPAPGATIRHVSWHPPPGGPLPGTARLLPSQILGLDGAAPRHRPLVDTVAAEPPPDDDATIAAIGVGVTTAMQNLAELAPDGRPVLLLSGGRDSRLLLSLAAAAELAVTTFTRLHRRAAVADRRLPPELARRAGYRWRANRQRHEIAGRREALQAHGGHSVADLSAGEFLEGGSDPLDGIALAGFCAELGRDDMLPEGADDALDGARLARHFGEDDPGLAGALQRWLDWRRAHPESRLSLADCFFLEQRVAGRKGAKEQLCDLFRVERVAPLNARSLLTLVTALSPPVRREASWIESLVARGPPGLAELPTNPPDHAFGFLRGRLLNPGAWRRLGRTLRGIDRSSAPRR